MKPGRFVGWLLLGIILGGAAVFLLFRFPRGTVPPATLSARTEEGLERKRAFNESGDRDKTYPARDFTELGNHEPREIRVIQVIDGDTIIIKDGEHVRIVGIDTPEREDPFFRQAGDFQRKKVLGKKILLHACKEEPRDRYGRLLAFEEIEGQDVGAQLLREGLARTLFVGPCGLTRSRDYRGYERQAFRAGRGIWSLQQPRRVGHVEATRYVGWLMTVTGKVKEVYTGPRAIHLNFGKDDRKDFTAVIFRKDLSQLSQQGLLTPVTGYKGKSVEVTGTLKEYNGPEIIIESADQIALSP